MNTHASAHEINFDGMVGPTHHFGGLSFGNLASSKNRAKISSPKRAALQGLEKMRWLAKQGFVQAILPPHERPHYKTLRLLGFAGTKENLLDQALKQMPQIFSAVFSSSFMWAANAATVSPSSDSLDNKTHISPANLVTMFHRSIEASFTTTVFQRIFADDRYFTVHQPLPLHELFADEGAANHNRLCPRHFSVATNPACQRSISVAP
jgi:succinylarginine dihydrolase